MERVISYNYHYYILTTLNTMTSEEQNPLLVPLLQQQREHHQQEVDVCPGYGLIEIDESSRTVHRRNGRFCRIFPYDITSTPVVISCVIIVIGFLVIFGFSTFSNSDQSNSPNTLLRQAASDSNPVAKYVDIRIPSQGTHRGYIRNSRKGREFTAFYKVPYARPPVGKLRFKDPEPPRRWFRLRDVPDNIAPQCIQLEKDGVGTKGDEDCLYSNIYVPNSNPGDHDDHAPAYPVMVYIHGSKTNLNGTQYGPEYFMDEDVILITFQFRLGALACLSTGDDVIRGNMGFKDMIQMLRWTKEHIQSFGGNPDKITLMGESAGSMNVGYILLSPMSKGLLSGAIQQSGGTLCGTMFGFIERNPRNISKVVGDKLGCASDDSEEFLKCMQDKPASEIVSKSTFYAITIEDRENPEKDSVFLPDTTYNLLKEGKYEGVPALIGNVNAEMMQDVLKYLKDDELINNLNDDFGKFGDRIITVKDINESDMRRIKDFYFGDKEIGNETMLAFNDLLSDKGHVHCAYQTAVMYAQNADTYLYWLTKPPAVSYLHKKNPGFPMEELGLVYHADELQFQFKFQYRFPEITTQDEKYFPFSEYFVKLWANFAATGNPNMSGSNLWNKVDPNKTDRIEWMELNEQPKITTSILKRMQFWDQFTAEQLKYA